MVKLWLNRTKIWSCWRDVIWETTLAYWYILYIVYTVYTGRILPSSVRTVYTVRILRSSVLRTYVDAGYRCFSGYPRELLSLNGIGALHTHLPRCHHGGCSEQEIELSFILIFCIVILINNYLKYVYSSPRLFFLEKKWSKKSPCRSVQQPPPRASWTRPRMVPNHHPLFA